MEYWQKIREKVGHEEIFLNFAGAAILDESGRVLLQKRAYEKQWGFPGGVMELGESFSDTAIREVKEETGLDVAVREIVGVYSKYSAWFPNGDRSQNILIFLKCDKIGGELYCDKDETLELRYFSFDEKPEIFNRQHEEMFEDLFGFLKDGIVRIR